MADAELVTQKAVELLQTTLSRVKTNIAQLEKLQRGNLEVEELRKNANEAESDASEIMRRCSQLQTQVNEFVDKFTHLDKDDQTAVRLKVPRFEARFFELTKELQKCRVRIDDFISYSAKHYDDGNRATAEKIRLEKLIDEVFDFPGVTAQQKLKKELERDRHTLNELHVVTYPHFESNKVRAEQISKLLSTNNQLLVKSNLSLHTIVDQKLGLINAKIKISDKPTVQIFQVQPKKFTGSAAQIQKDVADHYRRLAWKKTRDSFSSKCAKVGMMSKLTQAQIIAYHYTNPINPRSLLLYHSPGSGKTATMTLILSLYIRDGYMPIIVTKRSLSMNNMFYKAMFLQNAEWNIQQYLDANKASSLAEILERSSGLVPNETEVIEFGKHIINTMGGSKGKMWFKDMRDNQLSFGRFTYTCNKWLSNNLTAGTMERMLNHSRIYKSNDPFYKKVILMDEVHNMIMEGPSDDGEGKPLVVMRAFWKSRELSKENGPVVIAASATPGEYPFDAVMVGNLLCDKSKGIDFSNGRDLVYKDHVAKFRAAFDKEYPAPYTSYRRISELFAGNVSYFNARGDSSVPNMEPHAIHVELMRHQMAKIEECATKIDLVFDDYRKKWVLKNAKAKLDAGATREQILQARRIDKVQPTNVKAIELFVECARNQSLFPTIRGLPGKIEDAVEIRPDWLERVSPLYAKVVSMVIEKMGQGVFKQFIYIDKESREYGVKMMATLLESMVGLKSVVDHEDTGDLGGMLPLTKANKEEVASKYLAEFNSWEINPFGKKIKVVILDPHNKEGIDLADVGVVYIVGEIDSETTILQSVARAFRNCRTDPTHLHGNTNTVQVYLVTPTNGETLISDMVRAANPNKDTMAPMLQTMKDLAVDKDLLKIINNDSERVEQALMAKFSEKLQR